MDSRTQERVEQWDSRPFTGGYDELSTLADNEFSGAITANEAWLFMLNGRIVGITGGDLDLFEQTSGTVYAAPHPSLPLLCAMESKGGETQAKYYTNETPLTEVDSTLQDSSFTGYIELSEQVLSGDYYAVYYGGRRMAAAYIGNAQRLLTGSEAFERAADEVGIYEVVDVEIDVTDVPEPETSEQSTEPVHESTVSSPNTATTDTDSTAGETAVSGSNETETPPAGPESAAPTAPEDDGPKPDEPTQPVTDSDDSVKPASASSLRESADLTDPASENASATDNRSEPEPAPRDSEPSDPPEQAANTESEPTSTTDGMDSPDPLQPGGGESTEPTTVDGAEPTDTHPTGTAEDTTREATRPAPSSAEQPQSEEDNQVGARLEQEERWRETRSIPSIDPDATEPGESRPAEPNQSPSEPPSPDQPSNTQTEPSQSTDPTAETEIEYSESPDTDHDSTARSVSDAEQPIESLTQRIQQLEAARERLASENSTLEEERDRLQAQNQELSATVEQLRERVDELEAECERLRAAESLGADPSSDGFDGSSGRQLSQHEALSETNLFVRYESKSEATLQTAHDGDADRTTVASNLELESHTSFDASDVTVTGHSYEEFLSETMEYRFVDWLVGTLLFEIRDTGRRSGLKDLYDAIPKIDRAEFQATISLADDDTEDVPDEVSFDVVLFDKMGNPLVVATLNDSREPATETMLAELEETASAVTANYPELAAAMVVTASYFEPGAHEVTEQATSSGFLSRSSKLSYVNVTRKQGYHLTLIESRSGGFHVNVPEL